MGPSIFEILRRRSVEILPCLIWPSIFSKLASSIPPLVVAFLITDWGSGGIGNRIRIIVSKQTFDGKLTPIPSMLSISSENTMFYNALKSVFQLKNEPIFEPKSTFLTRKTPLNQKRPRKPIKVLMWLTHLIMNFCQLTKIHYRLDFIWLCNVIIYGSYSMSHTY